MANEENSSGSDKPDSDADEIFRDAMSDATPLEHEPRATEPRRAVAKAHFAREEKRQILHDSLQADYDERDIHSEDNLRYHHPSVGKKTMRKLARGRFAVQDEVDLHGMTVGEAQQALQVFISDACLRGFTCVRVVHGKGHGSGARGPVLKRKVASLLRRWPAVLAYVSARQVDGGTGAVYVLLEIRD